MFISISRGTIALALATILAGSTASAGIWLGSQNCLRLGHNFPSGASQANKYTQLKNQFATNNFNMLQEVMVNSTVASVKPTGYYYRTSSLLGPTSYQEAYGYVYNTTITGNVTYYTDANFSRPPAGLRAWTGAAYCWMVNYHAAFDAAPNATEIQRLNLVYNYFKNRSSVSDVIIAGDYNRTATSSYFNNLKATGCNQIQPNVATSINTSGGYANPYDHFAWNPSYTSVTSVARESITPLYWVQNVSDHAGIRCYVNN